MFWVHTLMVAFSGILGIKCKIDGGKKLECGKVLPKNSE